MPAVKTAISLDETLLERVDQLASELHVPRSRLLARAAEELLERYENRQMLSRLNRVHAVETQAHEAQRELRRHHQAGLRRRLEGEW